MSSIASASGSAKTVAASSKATPCFVDRYPIQTVGARRHQEFWIAAEDLAEMNRNIVGPIEVIEEYLGKEGG